MSNIKYIKAKDGESADSVAIEMPNTIEAKRMPSTSDIIRKNSDTNISIKDMLKKKVKEDEGIPDEVTILKLLWFLLV